MNNKLQPIIFCDFDGTFVKKEVSHWLFKKFTGNRNNEIVSNWKKGVISLRQCIQSEAELVSITNDQLHRFLNGFKLRTGADDFYQVMVKNNILFYLLSDGIDLYIDYILKKNELSEIKFFSNQASIKNGRLQIEFPHDNYNCERCGCCKGARIKDIIADQRNEYNIIFIGDGLSDICAIEHADYIFARGDLLKYCRSEGKVAFEYADFFDILNRLKNSGIISGLV